MWKRALIVSSPKNGIVNDFAPPITKKIMYKQIRSHLKTTDYIIAAVDMGMKTMLVL